MALTTHLGINVPDWTAWSDSRGLVSRELRGGDQANLKGYFQALHGLREAVFRRSLLVGLRMHEVQFKDAKNWLHDHDVTPDRQEFPKRFNLLYGIRRSFFARQIGRLRQAGFRFICCMASYTEQMDINRLLTSQFNKEK